MIVIWVLSYYGARRGEERSSNIINESSATSSTRAGWPGPCLNFLKSLQITTSSSSPLLISCWLESNTASHWTELLSLYSGKLNSHFFPFSFFLLRDLTNCSYTPASQCWDQPKYFQPLLTIPGLNIPAFRFFPIKYPHCKTLSSEGPRVHCGQSAEWS